MGANKLELKVLEEGRVITRLFADVDLLPDSFFIFPGVQEEVVQHFGCDLNFLAGKYVRAMRKASLAFYDILAPKWDYADVCEYLTKTPCTFVTNEAYQIIKPKIEKEKDNDQEVNPIAHCQPGKGIYLSLYEKFTETITGSIIHETGHDMHYNLYPKKYNKADSTMLELMAIFVQERCGYRRNYAENTPHGRAVKLLNQLRTKELFQRMNLSERWHFLVDFKSHEALQETIDDILK